MTKENESSNMFSYMDGSSRPTEEKIQHVWKYYQNDINTWTTQFEGLFEKFFSPDMQTRIATPDGEYGKNIGKMITAYTNGWMDPGDFLLMLNSVAVRTKDTPAKRASLIQALLRNELPKTTFFGVPSYTQRPALLQVFNEQNVAQPDDNDLSKIREISTLARKITSFDDTHEDDLTNLKLFLDNPLQNDQPPSLLKRYPAKITSILFYLNPECFIPLNGRTSFFGRIETAEEYIGLCKKIYEDQESFRRRADCNEIKLFPILSAYYSCGENQVAKLLEGLNQNRNIILTGAPGTGKTYSVKEYLKRKLGSKEDYTERALIMQFHPNVEYSDFIEGFRPVGAKDGMVQLELKNGVFKEFCKKAFEDPTNDYYFVVDEINRANLSAVFGEVLYTIEYRVDPEKLDPSAFLKTPHTAFIESLDKKQKELLSIYPEEGYWGKFAIPKNIYFIGTMNNVDRSIDSFDLALRRRFIWEEMEFDENAIRFSECLENPEALISKAHKLNDRLMKLLNGDSGYAIGHGYFMKIADYEDEENPYKALWDYHLQPLIREYLRSECAPDEIRKHLDDMVKEFLK